MNSIVGPRFSSGDLAHGEAVGVSRVRNRRDAIMAPARRDGGLLVAAAHGDIPSYVYNALVGLTADQDILTLQPSTSGVFRIQRITLVNPGAAAAAGVTALSLGLAAAPGSGGADVLTSIRRVDSVGRQPSAEQGGGPDSTFPGAARSGDTALAAGFVVYFDLGTFAVPAAAAAFIPVVLYDAADFSTMKPLTCGNSTAFLVLRGTAAGAGAAGLRVVVEFTADCA